MHIEFACGVAGAKVSFAPIINKVLDCCLTEDAETNAGIAGVSIAYLSAISLSAVMYFGDPQSPIGFFWVVISFLSIPINCGLTGVSAKKIVRDNGFPGGIILTLLYIAFYPLVFVFAAFYRVFKVLFLLLP